MYFKELYLQFDEEPTFPSYKEHISTLPIINHKSPTRPGQLARQRRAPGFLVYLKDWLVQFGPQLECLCMYGGNQGHDSFWCAKCQSFWYFGAKFTEHMLMPFILQFPWHAKQKHQHVFFQ
jgi:hypothetical protein